MLLPTLNDEDQAVCDLTTEGEFLLANEKGGRKKKPPNPNLKQPDQLRNDSFPEDSVLYHFGFVSHQRFFWSFRFASVGVI